MDQPNPILLPQWNRSEPAKFVLKFLAAACALFLIPGVRAQSNTGWSLVWSDEFNQPDGSSPDSAKWSYDTGGGGWGNSELEYYTSRTNNVRIEGGKLVIEARQENYLGSNYTSARLKTKGKVSWAYGRIEARIQIPRGQGIWPAFWMMGTNVDSVSWPTCGEIDIMENIGKEPTQVHGTIHGPGYSGSSGIGGPFTLPGGGAFADAFHVYAIEWTTNQIKWFVDGYQFFSVNAASLPAGTTWVFTQPQFILLNLAVGGVWPGNPDGTTVFPQRMTVDYIRVYAPTNLPANGVNALAN
ncbi:MAG TPA: glycoside hydrolase family 16 protein, partial [Candidatus Paceibacterota bacterium]|nr:glycoside hydrolase family 16 protein [Candidatus Paceibacterota bacterium]